MNKMPFNPSVDIESLFASIQHSVRVSPSPDSNAVIPTGLTAVIITKKSLKHVFHMEETKRKTDSIKHKALGGYHLITDELEDKKKVDRFCVESIAPYVCEGFIVNSTEHLPVYKTFFIGLNEHETIQCFQESLQNIMKVEDQGSAWLLEGKSTTHSIEITSIIKKANSKLTTFYPTSPRSRDSTKSVQQRDQCLYVRYYFNPCYSLPTTPDNGDVSSLHSYFGSDGIDVQLKVVHLDTKSIEAYLLLGVWMGYPRCLKTPDMRYGLLPRSVLETIPNEFEDFKTLFREQRVILQSLLQQETDSHRREEILENLSRCWLAEYLPSQREIHVLRDIDKIYLPEETIQKVFYDGNRRFPPCLTQRQILDKLKEAIANFIQLMVDDFQETKESDWEDLDPTIWSQRTTEDLRNDPFSPSWLPVERDVKITVTDWDYFGGPVDPPQPPVTAHNRYALNMMHKRLSSPGSFTFKEYEDEDVPFNLPLPNIGMTTSDQMIAYLRLFSSGTCFMDTWEFVIHLDLFSGNIVDFGIVLVNQFILNAMKPGFKYSSI